MISIPINSAPGLLFSPAVTNSRIAKNITHEFLKQKAYIPMYIIILYCTTMLNLLIAFMITGEFSKNAYRKWV
jgi:hypothetical protein